MTTTQVPSVDILKEIVEQKREIDGAARLEHYKTQTSDSMEFRLNKRTNEPGRSFSKAAFEAVTTEIGRFIGARVLRAWHARNQPPRTLTVVVKVTVTAK